MNAAETIAAAIEKLEADRAGGTPGPWEVERLSAPPAPNDSRSAGTYDDDLRLVGVNIWGDHPDGYAVSDSTGQEDAELIVTLHRTIDAQLAILRVARVERPANQKLGLDLARAILGVAS